MSRLLDVCAGLHDLVNELSWIGLVAFQSAQCTFCQVNSLLWRRYTAKDAGTKFPFLKVRSEPARLYRWTNKIISLTINMECR